MHKTNENNKYFSDQVFTHGPGKHRPREETQV